jgi:site-specific recombinase XerD
MTLPTLTQPTSSDLALLPQVEVEATRQFLAAQVSEATLRAYRTDARIFSDWCASRGVSAMPASAEVVATYLSSMATEGSKFSTISRRMAAIRFAHEAADLESPTSSRTVRAAVAGIRRTIGTAQVKKAPATGARIVEMIRLCPATLTGLRDKAMLLIGFAGAFRRSELVALRVEDITEVEGGLRVMIRRSKTDQDGAGQEIAIARGAVHCPVQALKTWLAAAAITEGPIFRKVTQGNRVLDNALTDRSVALLVKSCAKRAGLEADDFGGHSLRAGAITSAAERGAALLKMAELSRHKSLDVLRGYVRSAELFKDHALGGVL